MVHSIAVRELTSVDLEAYAEPSSQVHFERSLSALTNLSGVIRVKVFDRGGRIVWSDEPRLIGKHLTAHEEDLEAAMKGQTRAVLNPAERASHADEALPAEELIEFYIPFSLAKPGTSGGTVNGAISVYRSARELNDTIRRGLLLLWLVKGFGGLVLFLALYGLFNSVYRRQRAAESRFAKLSTEHERIVQMEKLSAMGRMVVEIAHQFNNPLLGVINLAQVAERKANDPQRVKELLAEIRKAGEHCSGFVQRMLRFAQLAQFEPQPTEMRALVRETIVFLAQSMGRPADVAFAAPDDEVVLDVDPVLLRHALFNLLHNAVQADPQGSARVELVPEERQGVAGWRLAVCDRGPGLAPEVAANLFTPFFTTRPGGTGLGLSVAQHIVLQHGGSIRAENNPGGGARFIVWLPEQKGEA
ncbi:MAG: two-component sensor histidine kinase [Rhodocyclales bacterium]|nr:two-component sensor histidine kinase [Rhodocyclales bacterium]